MSGFLKTLFGKKEDKASTTAASAPVEAEATLGVESDGDAAGDSAAPASDAEPIHVTDESFGEAVTNSPLPVLVDFWAPWCGPCRMVAPVIEDLAQTYDGRAVMAKVNTDESLQTTGKFGIMGIPTLILFKDGQEVDRVVGYAPQRVLEEAERALELGGLVQAFRKRTARFLRENWLFLLVVGGVVVGFMALRTPASAVGSVAEMDALLQNGQPTLVEFYSNT